MKKGYWTLLISVLVILSCQFNIEAKETLMNDLGIVKSYILPKTTGNTYISRDGSLAKPIGQKQKISLPGTYFLTTINENDNIEITTFTIEYTPISGTCYIRTTDELDELLKTVLETYADEVTIQFENGRYTIEELNQLINDKLEMLVKTYPKLDYKQYKIKAYGESHPKVVLKFEYASEYESSVQKYGHIIEKKVKEIIQNTITPGMTDYEREWAIANYLIRHITYGIGNNNNQHNIWGGLVDGIAVCDGYTKSLMYLLNSVGVPTLFIVGTGDGIPHSWNLVNIGGDYYHVDLTWADEEGHKIGPYYNYINETDAYMELSHSWDKKIYPKADQDSFLSIHRPYNLPGMYKIDSKEEWEQLKKEMSHDTYRENSLIFYDVASNKWSIDKILKELVGLEKVPIYYSSYYKYNCLVLNYALKK